MKTSTAACTRRVFAVRLGDTVELRVASKKPAALCSMLTKTYTRKIPHYDYYLGKNGHYKSKVTYTPVTQTRVLKQIFYVGGVVLGICKASQFKWLFGMAVAAGDTCKELPLRQANLVQDPVWRKAHLYGW